MRLIFYRTGAIGDVIHCLPALKFIKKQNPEASLELVTHCAALKDVLEIYASYIDKVFIATKKDPVPEDLRLSLRDKAADVFTYLHSNWLRAWYLKLKYFPEASLKIYKKDLTLSSRENFLYAFDPSLKSSILNERYDNGLLNALLDYNCLESHFIQHDSAIYNDLNDKHINLDSPYLVIVPGVGKLRPQRAFPLARWEEFINRLLRETDYKIKILGGADEAELSLYLNVNLKLRSSSNTRIENLIGKLSLLESTRVLESATKIYACDTGLLHIASALDKDVETIYSVSSEFRTGPYSPRAKILRSKYCKCAALKGFHDNKTKCKYLSSNDLPRCTEDLSFSC